MFTLLIGLWFSGLPASNSPHQVFQGPAYATLADCQQAESQFKKLPGPVSEGIRATTLCVPSEKLNGKSV
jgi:hypothetical protein